MRVLVKLSRILNVCMSAMLLWVPTVHADDSPIAEFQLYENLLRLMEVESHETTPFVDESGATITPDVWLRAKPVIVDSDNSIRVRMDMSLDGSAVGKGSQMVTRRKWSSATVQSTISGHLYKDVFLTPGGATTGPMHGSPHVNFWISETDNNFGLLHNFVKRKTEKKVTARTRANLPAKNAKTVAEINRAAEGAIGKANEGFRKQMSQVQGMLDDPKGFPYQARLSSRTTKPGSRGALTASFTSKDKKDRGERPGMENVYQPASAFYLHEDALIETISPKLAGKELRLAEVHEILCNQSFSKSLDFCQKDMDAATRDSGILFDKEKPFGISFENNQIKIHLNAIHQLHKEGDESEDVLNDPPASDQLKFQGSPYTIEVLYDIEPDRLKRKHVKILERPTSGQGEPKEEASGDLAHEASRFLSRSFQNLLVSPTEKRTLQESYEKAFKTEVVVPSVPLAFGIEVTNPKAGGKPRATRHGSMVPLETRAANGYLMLTNYACTDDMGAMGIQFQAVRTAQGHRLRITNVIPGSPAALVGLKVGDSITSYQNVVDEEDGATAISSFDYKPFLASVEAAASQKETGKREFAIEGVKADGTAFTRTLSLCPGGVDHKKEFEALKAAATEAARENAKDPYCKQNPGSIGISFQAGETNQPGWWGIKVTDVKPGSPAAKAGLKTGDFITAYSDTPQTKRWHLSSSDHSHFLSSIQNSAKSPQGSFFVEGWSNGQRFSKYLSVCGAK